MNKEKIIDFFDTLASKWDNEPISDKVIFDKILDNCEIKENIDVLDVGCGTGVLLPFYLERKVNSITAVDISPKMVEIAKAKFPQANIICGDAEVMDFEKAFDAIMVHNAFPHFPNPQMLLCNLTKALKVGGKLSIAHSLSKSELDKIHSNSANEVSLLLPEIEDLSKLFETNFDINIMISNEKMYQVVGTKR